MTKIVEIRAKEFSFPYALNVGMQNSNATKYAVMLSAHSLPASNVWLEKAIALLEKDPKTMGVYGPVKAMPDAGFWDKLLLILSQIIKILSGNYRAEKIMPDDKMGVLGFTNAIIRKDLWVKHNFDESYGLGGEDAEWFRYWLNKGFHATFSKHFAVHHSHYLNLFQWISQMNYWKSSSSKPQPFKYSKFRNDGPHKEL